MIRHAIPLFVIMTAAAAVILVFYLRRQHKKIRSYQRRCTQKATGTFEEYRYYGSPKHPKVCGARFSYRAPDGEIAKPVFPIQSKPFRRGDTLEFWFDPENYYFVCTDSMIKSLRRDMIWSVVMAAVWIAAGLAILLLDLHLY